MGDVFMLSLVGLLVIGIVVILLLTGKTSPLVGMVAIPIIGAFILGYNLNELNGFFKEGLDTVIPVAVMFIFAILFFGVMSDAGLFDPLVKSVIKLTNGNIILIAIGTVIVGSIAHLDGSGATTFLVTVPAFLAIYKKMGMSPNLLVMLVACSIGIVNFLPWGGPIARSAAVTGIGVTELWKPLIPFQIVGLVLLLIFAGFLGWREKKRISKNTDSSINTSFSQEAAIIEEEISSEELEGSNYHKKLIYINWAIFIGVLVLMMGGFLDPAFAFMIGLVVALPLNFRKTSEQMNQIKMHAPSAITMAAIILGAGMFLGILDGTGMLDSIAKSVVVVLPETVIPVLHLVVGFFGLPLDLVTSTDAYYFALLPLVEQIVAPYGVDSSTVVYSLAIGNNFGAMISPLAPATWLGIGLAGISIGSHLRYSFFWMWGFSLVLLLVAFLLGIVSIG